MADNSYCNRSYGHSHDWNVMLNKETITPEEWDKMEMLAASWVTCAVGNLCDVIPRFRSGEPIDRKLGMLGQDFSVFIERRNLLGAKQTLEKIEERSAYLIKQINGDRSTPIPATDTP